jgi:hypothetical protein
MAIVPVAPPLTNYYTVNDSSPGSQVWDLAAGVFVALSDATFNSWLSQLANAPVGQPYWPFYLQIQAASSSDAGTTTTFQVDNTSIITTGAKYNISGTGLYDGNRTITVVDGTHVKIPVAFAGNATGNLAGAGIIATAAGLNNLIRASGLTLIPTTGGFYSQNLVAGSSDMSLTNPMSVVTVATNTSSSGHFLTLPPMNAPNSIPIGIPFLIICDSSSAANWFLQRNDGVQLGNADLSPGMGTWLQLTSNSTAAGTVQVLGKMPQTALDSSSGGTGTIFQGTDSYLAMSHVTGLIYTVAALTAPRIWSLPKASACQAAQKIFVVDSKGGVSATNTLSVARASGSSDVINGGASPIVLSHAFGWCCLETDGVSAWSSVDASDAWVGMSGDATATRAGVVTVTKVKGNNPIAVADGGTGATKYNTCRMYLNNTQTGLANNVWTKVNIDTVSFDPDGIADTTNHRITPNTPGTYEVRAKSYLSASGGSGASGESGIAIAKNGTRISDTFLNLPAGVGDLGAFPDGDLVQMNGTTDFIEIQAIAGIGGGGTGTVNAGAALTYLSVERVGP